jgi:hypothetical protein
VKIFSASSIGCIAIATGVVALIGLLFITLFYSLIDSMDNPFGTLNDICVALGGILSGVLAWMLYPFHRAHASSASWLALLSGCIGAILAPIGSGLIIFNITDWFLAGLVTTFGYALLGLWLLILSSSALHWLAFPRALAQFGVVVGAVMTIGILAGPGILARIDSMDTAPWFVLTALYLGGLGWNILYTIWLIWLGRLLLSKKLALQISITT